VDAPPKNNEEKQYRQGLLRQIHQAASDIAVSDDGDVDMSEKSSKSGAEDDYEDDLERNEDERITDPMDDKSDEDLDSGREASRQVAQEETRQVQADPLLEMIHAGPGYWGGRIPSSSSTAFIDHEDPLYELGGRVYLALIDGAQQDVMVCNRNRCARCNKTRIDQTLLDKSVSITKGLPFVHATDLEVVTRVGFKFKQEICEYNHRYPKDLWETRVMFSDDVERQMMVCVAANCKHCSGEEAVDTRAARCLLGGDLYELEKAIERGFEK
jgi:hypothetical protein